MRFEFVYGFSNGYNVLGEHGRGYGDVVQLAGISNLFTDSMAWTIAGLTIACPPWYYRTSSIELDDVNNQ